MNEPSRQKNPPLLLELELDFEDDKDEDEEDETAEEVDDEDEDFDEPIAVMDNVAILQLLSVSFGATIQFVVGMLPSTFAVLNKRLEPPKSYLKAQTPLIVLPHSMVTALPSDQVQLPVRDKMYDPTAGHEPLPIVAYTRLAFSQTSHSGGSHAPPSGALVA